MLATVTWDGGIAGDGTDWHVAENWAGDQLPGETDDAVVPAQFSGTEITSHSPVQVRSVSSHANHDFFQIEVGAASQFFGNFSGEARGDGAFQLYGENDLGVLSATLNVELGSASTTRLRANYIYANPITIGGELVVEDNLLFASVIHVQPTGQIRIDGDYNLTSLGGGTIQNDGVIAKSSGDGVAKIFLPVAHQGTVRVDTGTLELSGGTQTGEVHFEIAAGAVVDLTDPGNGYASHTLSASNSGGGTLRVSSTLELASTSSLNLQRLELNGGAVQNDSVLQVSELKTRNRSHLFGTRDSEISGTGSLQVNTLQILGTTELAQDTTLSGSGTIVGATLTSSAILVTRQGRLTMNHGATVSNQGTWLLETGADVRAVDVGNTSSGSKVLNSGTFRHISDLVAPLSVRFLNTGLMEVVAGTLQLDGGGTNSGDLSVAEGTELQVRAYSQDWEFPEGKSLLVDGHLEISADTQISGEGELRLSSVGLQGGELSFRTATPSPNFSVIQTQIANLEVAGGTLGGWGEVTVTEQLVASSGGMHGSTTTVDGVEYRGKTILAEEATAMFTNSVHITERDFVTHGTTTVNAGQIVLTQSSRWVNRGTTNLHRSDINSSSSAADRGEITNVGVFRSTGDSHGSRVDATFQNSGELRVDSSELELNGPSFNNGSILVDSAATLELLSSLHQWEVPDHRSLDVDGRLVIRSSTFISGSASSASPGVGEIDIEQLELASGTLFFTYETPPSAGVLSPLQVSVPRIVMSGGTLGGYGHVTVTDNLAVSSGSMNGNSVTLDGTNYRGKLTVAANAESLLQNVTIRDRDIELLGQSQWSGYLIFEDGTQVINEGNIEVDSPDLRSSSLSSDPSLLTNRGTIHFQGDHRRQLDFRLHNTGRIELEEGKLVTWGPATTTGDFLVAAGAELELAGNGQNGSGKFTINQESPEKRFGGQGTIVASGLVSLSGVGQFEAELLTIHSQFTLHRDLELPRVQLGPSGFSAFLQGDHNLIVTEELDWQSSRVQGHAGIVIGSGAVAKVYGADFVSNSNIHNYGHLELVGNLSIQSEIDLINYETGTLEFASGTLDHPASNPPTLVNHGLVEHSGSGVKAVRAKLWNQGTVRVENNRLQFYFGAPGNVRNFDGTNYLLGGRWEIHQSGNEQAGIFLYSNTQPIDTLDAELILTGDSDKTFFRNQQNVDMLSSLSEIAKSGVLEFQDGYSFTIPIGDVGLRGTLRLDAASELVVQGDLIQHSTSWFQAALGGAPNSRLNARLDVQGNATHDGVFEVLYVDGYGPSEGDFFTPYIFDAGQGQFAEVVVPLLGRQPSLSVEERTQDVLVTSLVSASDLQAVPSSISFPNETNGGTEIAIEYTVKNLSATDSEGDWIDSLYLSLNDRLDHSDILLGRQTHTGGVAGNSSYTETAQVKLPALNEEQYRILVYPDSRGFVPDSDRSNNLAASVQSLDLLIAELPYNSPQSFPLESEQQVFYRIDVPWGAEVMVEALIAGSHQADVYARLGQVPRSYQYDQRGEGWGEDRVRLNLKEGGTWYLMVRGKDTAIASEQITLLANEPQLELRQIAPQNAYNLGRVTFSIEGLLLSADSIVDMVPENGDASWEAELVTSVDDNTLAATFDMSVATPGAHRIRVANASGSVASIGLNVLEGGEPGQLEFESFSTDEIRPKGDGLAYVVLQNIGHTDVSFSPIFLRETNDDTVVGKRSTDGLSQDNTGFEDLVDYTLLDTSGYVNGVIPPRGRVTYELQFKTEQAQPSPPLLEFEVKNPIDTTADLDWDEIQTRTRPYYIDVQGWDVVFQNLRERVGNSQSDLQTAMSEELAYLTSIGTPAETLDADAVVNFMLRQANDGFVSHTLMTQRDIASNAATLPLHFERSFQRSIVDRFDAGNFGQGWTHSFDYRVLINYQDEGLVRISTPEGIRTFRRRDFATRNGEFWFQEVGGSAVVFGNSSLILQEADGTSYLLKRFIDSTASWNFRLERVFDELGNSINAEYDEHDRLIGLQHTNGDSLTFEYAENRIRRTTDHAGREVEYTYDAGSQYLLSATTASRSYNYLYNQAEGSRSRHALTHVTAKDGSRLIFSYDENGRLASSDSQGDGADISFVYESGKVTANSIAGTSVTVYYNHLGQAAQVDRENGEAIHVAFDEDHYVDRLTLPGNHGFDFDFSELGLVSHLQSPDGSTISQNIVGQRTLRGQLGPFDVAFTMFKEPAYELTQLGDALERKSVYDYDDESRLSTIIYPDGAQEHFGSYNALGQPTEYTNRRGQSQVYEFSERGEILSMTAEEGTESFLYDSRGRLVQAQNEFLTSAFSYNDADRLLSVSHSNGLALYYGYDFVGKLVSLLDHDGQGTRYSYDAIGRLSELRDESSELIVAYFYDTSNRLARKEQGNGTATAYTYHELGQIETIRHLDASGNAQNEIRYEYDALGLRTSATDKNGNWEYTYDRLGQLILASFASRVPEIDDYEVAYEYDRAGNRVKTTTKGITASYGVNSRNQYTQVGEDLLSYDADGNLVKSDLEEQTTLYTYDSQNRLMRVSRGNDVWDYEYDALGNRVASIFNGQRTNYLLETTGLADVLGEYDASGFAVTRYSHGIGLESQEDASGSAAYYQFDALGSTTAITDSSGAVVNSYFYDPFGSSIVTPVESVENPFQYVGQSGVMQEQHGLQFMRARYYSPDLGRFVAEDPRRHDGGINLYRYVGNQPTLFVDPQGTYGYPGAPPFTSLSIVAELSAGEAAAGAAAEAAWLTPSAVTVTETAVVASEAATVAEGALVATEGSAITSTAGRALGGFILPELMVGITGGTLAGVAGFALGSAIVDAMPDVGSFWGDLAWDTWETLSESATRIVASWDPNDITGPLGVTEEHFQDSDRPLPYPYRIRFENLEEATAPAYQVVITQQLDESLDWSTFELVDFGFGNLHFEIPRGLSNYSKRIDLRPELDLLLDFKAGIDTRSGIVSWTFTSLSPDTLDIPIDPQLGFLPPNVESPQGQGYVNYRIHAKSELDDGQRITAQASIVFDTNEAIDTNVYRNAIDREVPASQVQDLPAEVYQEEFTVSWSGEDFDGSGVTSWDIYVSIDEGPYQLWLGETQDQQAIFTGELGKQYRFVSAATDYVGHVEKLPEQHDAETYLDPLPWQNSLAPNDVDTNGFVTPLDALIVINDLNRNGARALPAPQSQPTTLLDPSGDNFVTPLDALLVIDHLNSVSGEGESSDSNSSLIDMPFGAYWFSELDDREKKHAERLSPEILDLLLANGF